MFIIAIGYCMEEPIYNHYLMKLWNWLRKKSPLNTRLLQSSLQNTGPQQCKDQIGLEHVGTAELLKVLQQSNKKKTFIVSTWNPTT